MCLDVKKEGNKKIGRQRGKQKHLTIQQILQMKLSLTKMLAEAKETPVKKPRSMPIHIT